MGQTSLDMGDQQQRQIYNDVHLSIRRREKNVEELISRHAKMQFMFFSNLNKTVDGFSSGS